MAALFTRMNGTSCRSCGARYAAPNAKVKLPSVCETCRSRCIRWCRTRDTEPNENELNSWLARQLFLDVRRQKQYGVSGRCQAITSAGAALALRAAGRQSGYQCARPASMLRDGHPVCASHGELAFECQYIGKDGAEAYQEFKRLIADLCLVDPEFFAAVKEAVQGAEGLFALRAENKTLRSPVVSIRV